ncbi:MAG: ImmA/IrrE family metallo-endopeptidase [Lactococcus sp.]|jgi:Zn-dependent peptidase ImmA (M78 family)|uniref:ImmA/IrrE family metallo-endopeptidase n=1 Tax=Pseudolactococcus raffinolactis TaxID=1366 RepID=UPI001436C09F|nr:ImmA/IrrE family metallo-endopeptidase [Lactococcus raffinolactis]QIW52134.1 ImmA/IrrE family metallo-endopeptidase [Lactococcus raffinolactis]
MLKKIIRKIKELGIDIEYDYFDGHGFFAIENDRPILFIDERLNEIETSLTLLHETAHFLNGDSEKYITNHFQNDSIEFQANRYMIQEVMKMLDDEYNFTPDTNYQQIIDNLSLPYHLDGVIIDEFNNIISDKFSVNPYYDID